ncbi:MAG: c-type cytochrome [Alphaproteobacteria bacterium]|nr:c-type cytochrome [Alphaproteobacteria bacterium]
MRKLHFAMIIGLAPVVCLGAERPDWAFPVADKVQPPTRQDDLPKTVAGSPKSYTQAQIDDLKNPPDWFPDMHPPMPEVVGQGTKTFACGSCHLPVGTGHDESAYLAGLPAPYIVRQMADFKSGSRKGFGVMQDIAHALSDADVQSAATYFASLPARPWVRVVETDTVPKTYVNPGNMRLALPGGGTEPIGDRIVELPGDEEAAIERDPRSGFTVYAPTGSIAKGEALVSNGAEGRTTPCGACHGPTLQGTAIAPPIAGRHGNYLVRQLYFFQHGERLGGQAAMMKQVAQKLTMADMVAISAFLASLSP